MKTLTYDKIKAAYKKLGYVFHDEPCRLNIGGVRALNLSTNKFDDVIFCAYVSEIGVKILVYAQATTDPGTYYLKNPLNEKGCALLKEGQYLNSHKQGLHRGAYPALVQCGELVVYRDNDKNGVFNILPSSIERGFGYGINIHRASGAGVVDLVNKYSAGCQVFNKAEDLDYLLVLCDKQEQKTKIKTFDYTLLSEADI